MLYGNYCYIFIENLPKKFSPCNNTTWKVTETTLLRPCEFFNSRRRGAKPSRMRNKYILGNLLTKFYFSVRSAMAVKQTVSIPSELASGKVPLFLGLTKGGTITKNGGKGERKDTRGRQQQKCPTECRLDNAKGQVMRKEIRGRRRK